MLISETFRVDASIRELYEFLLDAQTVGACIPGCESVEVIGENEYDSIIKTKVGGISAKFKIRTHIFETVPFSVIRTVGQGKETRNLGQFKQKTEITLTELSAAETEVRYNAEVSIVGRLATFGDRILQSKAKTMGQEFANAVKSRLNPDEVTGSESSQPENTLKKKEKRWTEFFSTLINKIVQSVDWILGLFKCSKKSI